MSKTSVTEAVDGFGVPLAGQQVVVIPAPSARAMAPCPGQAFKEHN